MDHQVGLGRGSLQGDALVPMVIAAWGLTPFVVVVRDLRVMVFQLFHQDSRGSSTFMVEVSLSGSLKQVRMLHNILEAILNSVRDGVLQSSL